MTTEPDATDGEGFFSNAPAGQEVAMKTSTNKTRERTFSGKKQFQGSEVFLLLGDKILNVGELVRFDLAGVAWRVTSVGSARTFGPGIYNATVKHRSAETTFLFARDSEAAPAPRPTPEQIAKALDEMNARVEAREKGLPTFEVFAPGDQHPRFVGIDVDAAIGCATRAAVGGTGNVTVCAVSASGERAIVCSARANPDCPARGAKVTFSSGRYI